MDPVAGVPKRSPKWVLTKSCGRSARKKKNLKADQGIKRIRVLKGSQKAQKPAHLKKRKKRENAKVGKRKEISFGGGACTRLEDERGGVAVTRAVY